MINSIGSPTHTSASHADRNYASDIDHQPVRFVHTISEAGRLLPSASQWNSVELDFHPAPQSNTTHDSLLLTVASFAAEEEVFDAVKFQSRLTPDC
ncbi:hypothetical protein POTOM_021657 [Populus tomentosa]|uniref:Uncharacterized protein n=1 Tax=Populus tomentosa TaxID=118781 RepID=A0A8X8D394_POPTO|nr:hypothetical protein POTOM_021657 [Populus tomentosa]